ncbi:helicase HerA-like domain-containing protein [Candidatus Harpocratesius sp.]
MNNTSSQIIAKIEGKTTPFGFKIRFESQIPRKAFLAATHGEKTYILTVTNVWNNEKGEYGECQIIGNPPLTPFPLDSKIRRAFPKEIKTAIGMDTPKEKALYLGEIFGIPGLLATPNVEKLGRVFITGKSGSGKSYTVGVLIEELMKKQIPIIIIDRHGEYSSLKILDEKNIPDLETFFKKDDQNHTFRKHILEFADLTYNPQADLDLKYLSVIQMKELILPGQCITINLRGVDIPIQENIIQHFFAKIYKASTLREIPPLFIFLDEAHLFAGKKSSSPLETIKRIAQEGRKFGCNLVVITQKPQALDTTIRAQAGTWIIHKLTDINDIHITTSSAEGLDTHDEEEIQNLMPGEAIITGDITPFCPIQVKIRKRYTIHGGTGTSILEILGKEKETIRSDLINKFREKYTEEIVEDASKEIYQGVQLSTTELFNQIDNLRQKNYELQTEIKKLKQKQAEFLEQSKFSMKQYKSDDDIPEASKLAHEIDKVLTDLDENTEQSTSINLPKPEEMYDEKMLELMGERDDLKAELEEKNKILESMKSKLDQMIEKVQTFELEMSGIKVENQNLKDKVKAEQKRADDAVQLAERAVQAMKRKGKYR